MGIEEFNWKEIQGYYDDGHSTREVIKEFGCSSYHIRDSKKRGYFKARSLSEAGKIAYQKTSSGLKKRNNSQQPKKVYDWKEIQKFYNDNHTWRDVVNKFGCSSNSMCDAIKRGELVLRSGSEATKLHCKLYGGRRHTEEEKRNMSVIRTAYLKEHPDQVPYKLNHYTKKTSYPETYFKEVFEKEQIDLKHHKQVGLFEIDFYNEELGIAIEIDGEQHYVDPRIAESDKRKNLFLSERGWTVYRIRWAKYQKLNYKEKHQVVERIKSLLIKKERDEGSSIIPLTENFVSLLE